MKEHLEWCRTFIDKECILRCPTDKKLLIGPDGSLNSWQFYLPIGTLNQEFSYRIGLLFWDYFAEKYKKQPFQICGCESGGVPLITTFLSVAWALGIEVNGFMVKKEAKKYGLKNWYEGTVLEDLPVLMIDDVTASKKTLTDQATRLHNDGLKLYNEAFCIVSCKRPLPLKFNVADQTIDIVILFGPEQFVKTESRFKIRYGHSSCFRGTIV